MGNHKLGVLENTVLWRIFVSKAYLLIHIFYFIDEFTLLRNIWMADITCLIVNFEYLICIQGVHK
jgi:hypothetical protein